MSKHPATIIKAILRKTPPDAIDVHRNARSALFAYEHIATANTHIQDAYRNEHRNRFNISPATMREIEEGIIKQALGPDVVMIALAVELYLKARLLADTGRYKRVHEVVRLFRQLPAARQHEIVVIACGLNAFVTAAEFDGNLAALNDSFIAWRYSYEYETLNFPVTFAHVLATALRSTFEPLT